MIWPFLTLLGHKKTKAAFPCSKCFRFFSDNLIFMTILYWNIHSSHWTIHSFIVYSHHIMDVLNHKQWLEKYKLCSKFFFDFFRFFSKFFEKLNIVFRIFRRPWKDHFKSDLRSDQDHLLKKDLRSDQDHIFEKNDLDLKSRSKIIF
jgi:hypothetical protein